MVVVDVGVARNAGDGGCCLVALARHHDVQNDARDWQPRQTMAADARLESAATAIVLVCGPRYRTTEVSRVRTHPILHSARTRSALTLMAFGMPKNSLSQRSIGTEYGAQRGIFPLELPGTGAQGSKSRCGLVALWSRPRSQVSSQPPPPARLFAVLCRHRRAGSGRPVPVLEEVRDSLAMISSSYAVGDIN